MSNVSSPTFNINDFYKIRLPRGENLPPVRVFWDTSESLPLEVNPAVSPENYVAFVKELWFYDNTITFTESVSGDGLIVITYPDYNGGAYVTFNIIDMAHIYELANRQETINSIKYNVIELDPPALIFASKTALMLSVAKHANVVSVDSGGLTILAKKMWTLPESIFD